MHDLETISGFGGFCFQIASDSAWQGGGAGGTIEDEGLRIEDGKKGEPGA
jgi:hypothetical protein